jgi:hypothetical protein
MLKTSSLLGWQPHNLTRTCKVSLVADICKWFELFGFGFSFTFSFVQVDTIEHTYPDGHVGLIARWMPCKLKAASVFPPELDYQFSKMKVFETFLSQKGWHLAHSGFYLLIFFQSKIIHESLRLAVDFPGFGHLVCHVIYFVEVSLVHFCDRWQVSKAYGFFIAPCCTLLSLFYLGFPVFSVHNLFVLSCFKMASAAPICTCIKTSSNTPTCENCVKSLQPTEKKQHCRLKDISGKSVHNPHKGLWPHTLECAPVPPHIFCGYFHLPTQCRYCHNVSSMPFIYKY